MINKVGMYPNIIWETCNENFANQNFHIEYAKIIKNYENQVGYQPHLVMPIDLPEHRDVPGKSYPPKGTAIDTHKELLGVFVKNQVLISDADCCENNPPSAVQQKKGWMTLVSGAYMDAFNTDYGAKAIFESQNTKDTLKFLGAIKKFVDQNIDLQGSRPIDDQGQWVLDHAKYRIIMCAKDGVYNFAGARYLVNKETGNISATAENCSIDKILFIRK
jgi:hypothetical protein